MRRTHLIGLALWRGGLLLVGGTLLYEGARRVLWFVDLPAQVEFGVGLGLAGLALVMLSLVLERVRDARREGDLRQ